MATHVQRPTFHILWLCNLQHLLLCLDQGWKPHPGKWNSSHKFFVWIGYSLFWLLNVTPWLLVPDGPYAWTPPPSDDYSGCSFAIMQKSQAQVAGFGRDGIWSMANKVSPARGAGVSTESLGWQIWKEQKKTSSFYANTFEVLTISMASKIESKQKALRKQMCLGLFFTVWFQLSCKDFRNTYFLVIKYSNSMAMGGFPEESLTVPMYFNENWTVLKSSLCFPKPKGNFFVD